MKAQVWLLTAGMLCAVAGAQVVTDTPRSAQTFDMARGGRAVSIVVSPEDSATVRLAAKLFADDVERVTGTRPQVVDALPATGDGIVVGSVGHSTVVDGLNLAAVTALRGKWESGLVRVVPQGGRRLLVVAGSDRRGTAYELLGISRAMGVSPWYWWADVPAKKHASVSIQDGWQTAGPSVPYRGVFLNDEDWGLRPWAARKMDPELKNIGPHTYERIFELLLRLRANLLWPAMHPGTLAFNAVPANAKLADEWGIVMGASHSEALLRNNVGEWDEQRDGPWNYQLNKPAMDAYWDKRIAENGRYENFYTVGLRGAHDSGLEATGTKEVKAQLVESVMASQQAILKKYGQQEAPQVDWLYKESIDLYRVGMKVPENVTLGWTDDNYGYIRQLPNAEEQKRKGGSAVYYHVSYWGFPHDHLWLATTPLSLMQEELTKAYAHNARKLWVLNVGDIKPSEIQIDYFLQLAWDEPKMAQLSQRQFLEDWMREQFGAASAKTAASVMADFYRLNFVRRPEFMGFNGYDDDVNRTAFNPLAWGDQNQQRMAAWNGLVKREQAIPVLPAAKAAWYELVKYPIEAASAHNAKFLWADRAVLDAHAGKADEARAAAGKSQAAYDAVQSMTAAYNALQGGKWDGMMPAHSRDRHVFDMPKIPLDSSTALPVSWGKGDEHLVSSVNAMQVIFKSSGVLPRPELGITGGSLELREDGEAEFELMAETSGDATLAIDLLPDFPIDSDHTLRYQVQVDGGEWVPLDASGTEQERPGISTWKTNVLRGFAEQTLALPALKAGRHTVKLRYAGDPGVVIENVSLRLAGAPPAYPVAPEMAHP
ncbi:glycosyl hydrolase 115 family protein [Terriglobus tenax]|uniref:glycosyl hydrolase 115 family protein n=1 Tax=Terriglobus tenax TaxID=1111115 RepID=UPI0021E037D7|nr:glycosyl hydrolase 115 family protein [Terriglobus tenax]